MLSPELQVPVRVAAELFYRSSCLNSYLERIGSGESSELERLLSAMRRGLENWERKTINSLAELWNVVESQDAIPVLWRTLAGFSRWFATIHETLVLLPGERTTSELAFTLQHRFGEVYTDYGPSIVLGSVFNAFEFDFIEILKQKLVDVEKIFPKGERIEVLQLPICGRDSPLAYPVLAHELGHAIDKRHRISSKVASQFVADEETDEFSIVRDWCSELCADIVAARAFGPCAILELLSMEYCFHPLQNLWHIDESHPMSRARLDVVLRELDDSLDHGLIEAETDFYTRACDVNLERWYPNEADRDAQKQLQETLRNEAIPLMADRVREELLQLDLPIRSEHFLKEPVNRCVNRLCDGSPVSAQGESRDSLHPKVRLFQQQCFESPEGREKAFKTLCREFGEPPVPSIPNDPQEGRGLAFRMVCGKCEETPLKVPTILLSGHLRRSRRITDLFEEKQPLSTPGLVESLCDSLADLDRLIRNSIMTACVHQRVLDRLRAPKQE